MSIFGFNSLSLQAERWRDDAKLYVADIARRVLLPDPYTYASERHCIKNFLILGYSVYYFPIVESFSLRNSAEK